MSEIEVTREGAVTTVRIARPAKKNALTLAMYDALTDAFTRARDDDETRALVLLGQPGVFTAGNDILDFVQNPPGGEDSPVFRFLLALTRFPKPVVAAVDGAAVGVGTTLLLHCDVVLASPRARFVLPFVSLGLVPEGASSVLLPARVGMARASQWLMSGEPVDAESALRAGLVGEVVPAESLEARARQLADAIAQKPAEAMRITKELLRGPLRAATEEALAREGEQFVARLASPETMAAFGAFLSKKG